MSTRPRLYLAALGMITAIGGSALTTAAAVRARRKGARLSAMLNKHFEPMRIARVPAAALPLLHRALAGTPLTARTRLLLRILAPALEDALAAVPLREPPPLFLATPEALPGLPNPLPPGFLELVEVQAGLRIDRPASRLLATGRAGGLQAIDLALKYFASLNRDVALIGGVDSFFAAPLLARLDRDDRIAAPGVTDGFAPGEAAAVLLVVTERVAGRLPHPPLAVIHEPGFGSEPGHRFSKEPYRGDGLAEAFRRALESGPAQPVETIYSSQNGEHFGAKEFGVAVTRNCASLGDNVKHEHPADCLGDVGAAMGPALIGLAALDLQKGWRQGSALVYAAAEQAARAAVVVGTI